MGRETVRLGSRRYVAAFVVSESAPGKRIAWRLAGGIPLVGDVRLDLEPLMAGEIRAGEAAELQRLKGILETPAVASAATA